MKLFPLTWQQQPLDKSSLLSLSEQPRNKTEAEGKGKGRECEREMRAWGPRRIHCAGVNEESEKERKEREMVKWVCQQRAVLKPTQCGGNLKWLTALWTTLPFSSRNAGGSPNTSTTYSLWGLRTPVVYSLHSHFCHAGSHRSRERRQLFSFSFLLSKQTK